MRLKSGSRGVRRVGALFIALSFFICASLFPSGYFLTEVSAQTSQEKKAFLKKERQLVKDRKKQIDVLLKEAKSLRKGHEYEAAIARLEEVLELDPIHHKAQDLIEDIEERMKKDAEKGAMSPIQTAQERAQVLDREERQDTKTQEILEQTREAQLEAMTSFLEELERAQGAAAGQEAPRPENVAGVDALFNYHYDKGKAFMDQGRYKQAVNEFRAAWQIDPNHKLVPKVFTLIEDAEAGLKGTGRNSYNTKSNSQKVRSRLAGVSDKLTLSGSPRYDSEINDLLRAANLDLRAGRVRQAVLGFHLVLSKDPKNVEAISGLKRADKREIEREQDEIDKQKIIDEREMLLEVDDAILLPEEDEVPGPSSGKAFERGPAPFAKVHFRDRLKTLISLDFNNVTLVSVLDFLAMSSGVNIVTDEDVQGAGRRVTTFIKDMQLEDALKYILKSHALTYRIEDEAVWVTTHEALEGEKMETQLYRFKHGAALFERLEAAVGGRIGSAGGYAGLGGAPQVSEVVTLKEIIEQAVPFPQGSNLTYDERTGALIITNTPNNHRIIDSLIYELDVPPSQVLIEARFIEVDVTHLDEFVGDLNLDSVLKIGNENNRSSGRLEVASGSGFNVSTSTILTGPGASGSSTSLASASEGFNLSLSGILTRPQFTATLNALKEMDRTKTLSAPRITTLNHQTATIEVTDEFIYPTRYEVQLIQFDINGDGDFEDAEETQFANVPQEFATRDVGVILRVTPDIGADMRTVNLSIIPEVTTADDPGTSAGGFSFAGNVDLPKFTTSNVSTSVSMSSGDTVVLGGLIQETHERTETRIPLISDIPFLGKLFRKERESLRRRNLLIFVTATILEKPAGFEVASNDTP